MTFEDWREAVRSLQSYVELVTTEQMQLSREIGTELDPALPALVASEHLKRALKDPLRLENDLNVTYGQSEFLNDLSRDLGERLPDNITTKAEATAWILVLDARRAIQSLRRLRLKRGDIVRVGGRDDEIEVVASIGADGIVYFEGGRGQRARPHRLIVLARAGSRDPLADRLRKKAALRGARRAKDAGTPSAARLATLDQFRVDRMASTAEAVRLETTLESAQDERPLQRLLTEVPEILAALVRSTYGTFVVPLPRLGSQYIPDFAIAAADSAGIHWTVVELESPKAAVATQDGRPAVKLRLGLDQIRDWRDWLENNLNYARNPRDREGLGLTDIRSDAAALLLVGRTDVYHSKFNSFRHRLVNEQRITVHTYSWLAEKLRSWKGSVIGPLENRDTSW